MNVRDVVLAQANSNDKRFAVDCPGRTLFEHLTSRWSVLALLLLTSGTQRFHVLRDQMGVSERMLSKTLRTLTRDGLVGRSVEATVPPRVSYELTSLGHEIVGPLGEFASLEVVSSDVLRAAKHSSPQVWFEEAIR